MKRLFRCVLFVAAGLVAFAGTAHAERPATAQGAYDLRIGSDEYEPFFYRGPEGGFTGIDVDMAVEACRRLGCRPVFLLINWQNRDDVLALGQVDCLWGSYVMTGREANYDWAGPYMRTRQVAAVRGASPIASLADITGERIAIESGGVAEKVLTSGELGAVKPASIMAFSTFDMAAAAAMNGYADAVVGHETAIRMLARDAGTSMRFLMPPVFLGDLGVAFRKSSDSVFRRRLAVTLSDMLADGTVCEIVRKYGADGQAAVDGLGVCR